MAQPVLLLHQILCFAGGMSEQFGAAGVVGGVLNRTQNKLVKAVFVEPVRCGKDVMEGAAARPGNSLAQVAEKIVDQVMAASDSGHCQYWHRAVGRQRVLDVDIGGD